MLEAIKAVYRAGAGSSLRQWGRFFLLFAIGLALVWEILARPVVLALWPDAALPPSCLRELLTLLLGLPGV